MTTTEYKQLTDAQKFDLLDRPEQAGVVVEHDVVKFDLFFTRQSASV